MSINDSNTNNNYWTILSGDYSIDTNNVDHLYNSYITSTNINTSIIYQELTENDSINASKSLYIIKLDSQLSNDIIFTLDNLNQIGLKKTFILSDSALNNLNNKNIIIRSKYFTANESNSSMLKIKLNNLNQYLELVSIDYLSNKYYQILNNVNSNFIEFDNTQQTLSLVPEPLINYEIITYDVSINNVLSTELDFSIIELNQTVSDNIYLYLPINSITNQNKHIIIGSSVNQYINNKSIYLYTIIVDILVNTSTYYIIEFKKSGQFINLVSINNNSNKYYQILNSDLTNVTNLNSPPSIIRDLVEPTTDIVESENLIYTVNENNAVEILEYNKNQNNIVDFNKKFTVIELSENLTNDAYILIPNLKINGVEKNIIMGQSVSYFSNNYKIILYSKYTDLEGRGPMFLNLRLSNTGQILSILSFIFTKSDGLVNKYNQILIGSYESSDEIRFNSLGNYVNVNNPTEVYDTIIDDDIYTTQYLLRALMKHKIYILILILYICILILI